VWIQAVSLVFVFGFLVFGILAWGPYACAPPIPATVTDPAGRVFFTYA
jgi:nitric oxide reductase subunit B